MPTQTIVVTNNKGGVGKTTTTTHLGGGLAAKGHRVCIVDVDPQGHVALMFGMKKENGLYLLMCDDDTALSDVIRVPQRERYMPAEAVSQTGELYVIPSAKGTVVIPSQETDPFAFREILQDMGEMLNLDYIIVDTSPTSNMFDRSVNLAADFFLYVTECNTLSFDGLQECIVEIDRLNNKNSKYNIPPAQIMGIVPNKAKFRTRLHREEFVELQNHFNTLYGEGTVWEPIREGTSWEYCPKYGQLLFSLEPHGQNTQDAWGLVDQAERKLVEYGKA